MDRDQALEMAIRGEQTRDFTEMNGEVAVGLSSGTLRPPRSFCHHRKERRMGCSDLAKMPPKGNYLVIALPFSLRADNELYQTIN